MSNRTLATLDYSTINLARLRRLPVYQKPPTYFLSDPGACCYLDAPGFPTYFLRSVYTQYGNNPPWRNGRATAPDYAISDPTRPVHYGLFPDHRATGEDGFTRWLMPLWVPLPIDHERVHLWMRAVYVHFQHCYYNPLPDDRSGSHAYVADRMRRDYGAVNHLMQGDEDARLEDVANHLHLVTPENHYAVHAIRVFYPEHTPIEEWIEKVPVTDSSRWWEAGVA